MESMGNREYENVCPAARNGKKDEDGGHGKDFLVFEILHPGVSYQEEEILRFGKIL